jgi:hypothetical protein
MFIVKNAVTQCVPVPKTNRISEADFSALDRLEKNAPQKSTLAKSGIINYTNITKRHRYTLSFYVIFRYIILTAR